MSNKPEGAGWIETSVEDRYASMKAPVLTTRGNHPNMKPIGADPGTSAGYKPCGSLASENPAKTTGS